MPVHDRLRHARRLYEVFARGDRRFVAASLTDDFVFFSPLDVGLDRAGYFERCWPGSGRGPDVQLREAHRVPAMRWS